MTDTLTSTDEVVRVDEEIDPDNPIKTHIVSCPDDKSSTEAWLTEARVFGLEVEAICGYTWIPELNPDKYPICAECLEEAHIRSYG